jgi:hypothetical protein
MIVEDVHPPIDDGERLWWGYPGADGNQTLFERYGEALKRSRPGGRGFSAPRCGAGARRRGFDGAWQN